MLRRRKLRLALRIEIPKPIEIDALDVTADASFREGHHHPRFEPVDHARTNVSVRGEEVIQSIRPGVHQLAHLWRTFRVVGLQFRLTDIEARAKVLPDGLLAIGLRRAAEIGQVIGFDAREVVLRLCVDHAEHRVSVSMAVDVGDAPVVARDRHVRGFGAPSGKLRRRGGGKEKEQGRDGECAHASL
jgi:hypothetical protein